MSLRRRIGIYLIPILVVCLAGLMLAGCNTPLAKLVTPNPVANIQVSPSQSVSTGTQVTLSGSNSTPSSPDTAISAYAWVLVTKPSGSAATLSSSSGASVTFTPDLAGTYTVRLTVTGSPSSNQGQTTTNITATGGGGGGWNANILASNITTSAMDLSWTANANALGYKVFRDTSSGGSFATQVGGPAPQTGTTIHDSGLQQSTPYYYVVKYTDGSVYTTSNVAGPFTTPSIASTLVIPTLNVGTTTSSTVPLSWNAPSGATNYNVVRYSPITGDYTIQVYTGTATSTTESLLVPSSTYSYKIRAYYGDYAMWSDPSAAVSATTQALATAPNAPTNVSVGSPTSSSLTVYWSLSAGATSYEVRRFVSGTYTNVSGTSLGASATSFTDNNSGAGLTASTTYYYQVFAINGSGTSPASSVASGTTAASGVSAPAAPSISVGSASTYSLTVSWGSVPTATGYYLYRQNPDLNWVNVYKGSNLSFTDTALTPSTGYSYYATAYLVNNSVELASGPSNYATGATTALQVPNQPYLPSPSSGQTELSATGVIFSWSAPYNPDGDYAYKYDLYLSTTASFSSQTVVNGLTSSTWTPYAGYILPSTTYYWYVVVKDSQGHSNQSPVWTFATAAAAQYGPTATMQITSAGPYYDGTPVYLFGSWVNGSSSVPSLGNVTWTITYQPSSGATITNVSTSLAANSSTATLNPSGVGYYDITFTVTDSNNLSGSWTKTIYVNPADSSGAAFWIH